MMTGAGASLAVVESIINYFTLDIINMKLDRVLELLGYSDEVLTEERKILVNLVKLLPYSKIPEEYAKYGNLENRPLDDITIYTPDDVVAAIKLFKAVRELFDGESKQEDNLEAGEKEGEGPSNVMRVLHNMEGTLSKIAEILNAVRLEQLREDYVTIMPSEVDSVLAPKNRSIECGDTPELKRENKDVGKEAIDKSKEGEKGIWYKIWENYAESNRIEVERSLKAGKEINKQLSNFVESYNDASFKEMEMWGGAGGRNQ